MASADSEKDLQRKATLPPIQAEVDRCQGAR